MVNNTILELGSKGTTVRECTKNDCKYNNFSIDTALAITGSVHLVN